MRRFPFVWLDVFADRPLAGNALCVFPDATGLTDAEMQAIARETNLSETTFVLPPTRPGATYRTRIFTPGGELPFAGHPTLGTAAALAVEGRITGTEAVQETLHGLTPIRLEYDGQRPDRVIMEAPAPSLVVTPDPEPVARALGLEPEQVMPGGLRPAVIEAGVRHLIVPVGSVAVLSSLEPDQTALAALSRELNVIGAYPFTLLAGEGAESHARARLFAPLHGIPEDAATGSAAGPLGFYLHRHGLMPAGRTEFWYEQGVEMGRPSRLWVEVTAPGVRVGGRVRLIGRGVFDLSTGTA